MKLTIISLHLGMPHPVKSTISLLLPLTLVPCTLELVAVYPAHAVLSMMLPSLPNISSLESSLNYSLEEESNKGFHGERLAINFYLSLYSVLHIMHTCIHM